MTRLEFALLTACASGIAAVPAAAQHHHMPGMTMPAPKKAASGKPAAKKKAVPRKAAVEKAVPKKAAQKTKPAAASAADPHAGHDMSAMPASPAADPHAGHNITGARSGTNLPAGNAPPPPPPTDRAADAVYGADAMRMGRHHVGTMHGGQKFSQVMVNLAEYQVRQGLDGYRWDGEAWYGGDIDRLWLKSEGEADFRGGVERAEVQLLYSHAVGPYFNLTGGARYDVRPNPSRAYATIGVEGLAPGLFDVAGALFLSNKGEVLARAEGSYDQRISQRLILQPRAELNFAAQDSRATLTGAGLSNAELGLRLRYDIRREISPYVGIEYSRSFGTTRDLRRDAKENVGGVSFVAGIRTWF